MSGRVFLKNVCVVLLLLLLLLFLQIALVSCGGKGAVSPGSSAIKSVAVIPFFMNSSGDSGGESQDMPGDAPDGAFVVTSLLIGMLNQHSSFDIVPIRHVPYAPVPKEREFPSEKFLEYVMEAGRLSGADAVFCGRVNFFRERVGGNYSVSMPAAVSFDIVMVSALDGKIVWSGQFDESQSSLIENLLTVGKFIKRRGRWVTAEEIAAGGMKKVFQSVPVAGSRDGA